MRERTLRKHVKGVSSPSKKRGNPGKLSEVDEDMLAEWVIAASLRGFSPTKIQIVHKVVHDAKMGKVMGSRGPAVPLFLVEWVDYPAPLDFTWEPCENFGPHGALVDAFIKEWKEGGKAWPPAAAGARASPRRGRSDAE